MRRCFFAALTLGVLLPGSMLLRADDKTDGNASMDQKFVHMASASDIAEIELGKLALKRAGSSDVKQFGQRMMMDHMKSSKELLAIARDKNLKPASQMDEHHQKLYRDLSKTQGDEFDRKYIGHMVKDHQAAVKLFSTQATKGTNEDLKNFATRTLPVIRGHLEMSMKLHQSIGAANTGTE